MKSLVPLIVAVLAALAPGAIAQVPLAEWPLAGVVDGAVPVAASGFTSQAAAGEIFLSNHLVPRVEADGLVATGWPTGSRDESRFIQFSIRARGDRAVDFDAFTFKVVGPAPGTCDWEIRASHDGYTSTVSSGTVTDLSPGGASTTAPLGPIGTRAEVVRLRLYLFGNTGAVAPDRRGLLGLAGGGIDPVLTGTTPGATAPQLVHWALNGTINSANPINPSSVAGGLDAGPIRKAPGLGAVTQSQEFEASGFPTGGLDPNAYLELSVTPDYRRGIAYSRFIFSVEASTTLFNYGGTWQIRTDVDGFSSSVATGTFGPFGGPSDVTANITSVGFQREPVTFRLYYHGNFGASQSRRGFQRWFGSGVHNGDGPKILGVLSELDVAYPGTFEDLATNVQAPGNPFQRVNASLSLAPGDPLTMEHLSPNGGLTFAGPLVVLASTNPTGTAFPSPFPGVWLELATTVTVIDQNAFGFPLLLPPQGLRWSFTYAGGFAGTSVCVQAHVLTPNARNGALASSDALELILQ